MKLDIAKLLLCLALTTFFSPFATAQDGASTGAVATSVNVLASESRVSFYPQEMAFGDVGYFATFQRNVSGETIQVPKLRDLEELKKLSRKDLRLTVSAPELGSYSQPLEVDSLSKEDMRETPYPAPYDRLLPLADSLAPGAERRIFCVAFEFPPLEASKKHPFWTKVRERLATDDEVKLNLTFHYVAKLSSSSSRDRSSYITSSYETWKTTVVLKNRAAKEDELLSAWYEKIEPFARFYFPSVHIENRNNIACAPMFPPFDQDGLRLKSSGQSDIEIGDKSYDPWLFVRVGNRKPSDPNNPTTVDGWRELEAEFAPSTLRDEITLTRLQLEYYDADEGEASDAASKALVDWLSQRPEPQRVVLSQSLLSKRGKFQGTPLEAKNATLCNALTSAFPVETPSTNDAK